MAAAVLLGAACSGEPERTLTVAVPAAGPVEQALARAFEAGHPGVTVRLVERPDTASGPPPSDAHVWWGADGFALEQASARDGLAPLPPAAPPSPSPTWLPVEVVVPVVAWNTDSVPRSMVPRDVRLLFHERWRRRVLLPDPRTSLLGRALVGWAMDGEAMRTGDPAAGLDWLRRLDVAAEDYVPPRAVAVGLASGRAALGVADLSDAVGFRVGGAPVGFVPLEGGLPGVPRGVAVLPGADTALAGAFVTLVAGEAGRRALTSAYRVPWEPGDDAPPWIAEATQRLPTAPLRVDAVARGLDGWLERWRAEALGRGERMR